MTSRRRRPAVGASAAVGAVLLIVVACGGSGSGKSSTPSADARKKATVALCREIDTAVSQVADGRPLAGGLRLSKAIGTYEKKADPAVVEPARQLLRSGIRGDPDTGTAAINAVSSACTQAGVPVSSIPGTVECIRDPCP